MAPHILVVDDEEVLARMVARILQGDGYAATAVASPLDALAILTGPDPLDLLLTDVRMAELSGTLLAALAQQIRPGLPTILSSGYPPKEEAGGIEPHHFLPKPYTHDELLAVVQRVLPVSAAA